MTLFFLSAATLLFEIDLSRLLSVSQFYHFAFMVVSLALLGYGASGTFLALFPTLLNKSTRQSLAWVSLACGFSILGAYLLMNYLPFDSFSIAWDRRQALILALHYLMLSLPFFFNGLAVGLLLAKSPQNAGRIYSFNLLGSACGCLLALIAPTILGGEGLVVLSSGLGFLAALSSILEKDREQKRSNLDQANPSKGQNLSRWIALFITLAGMSFVLIVIGLRASGQAGFRLLDLRISPYKSLSAIRQQPGSRLISSRWNAFSRVDVISSPGIHSFPGLSYRYLGPLPAQQGVLVDGDDLSPLVNPDANLQFCDYLPAAVAFHLRPAEKTLVLGGRGGLDSLTALSLGAQQIDAVEFNPLITAAAPVYADPRVRQIVSDERSYLRRTQEKYNLILLSLNATFHPIRSGAYSLIEDYRDTEEAFEAALARLDPTGVFVVTRWLQNPPSEDLRTFGLAISALERLGLDPRQRIVALRGYNTATFLVQTQPFTPQDLVAIRHLAGERAFDLTYAPGIKPEETNLYNVLSEPVYYQAYQALLDANPRQAFYDSYPFDVSPPTDDHPFFGHFFKWSQARQVLSELGKTWQPFGGAGYFVILALLILSVVLASALILLPVLLARFRKTVHPGIEVGPSKLELIHLLYFALIGFAYLFVEIPLIQKFILFLGQPAYAMSIVLFTLLLFSGIGSWLVNKISLKLALALLVLSLAILPSLAPTLFQLTIGLPFLLRLVLTVGLLAPVGFLMGIPFPAGISQLEKIGLSSLVPWSWGVNGSASVVSAVLAALLALTFGFSKVLGLGALCYLGALLAAWYLGSSMATRSQPSPPLPQ